MDEIQWVFPMSVAGMIDDGWWSMMVDDGRWWSMMITEDEEQEEDEKNEKKTKIKEEIYEGDEEQTSVRRVYQLKIWWLTHTW